MFQSAVLKRKLLMVLFCLVGWAHFVGPTPASAQFKVWVMAKFPNRPWGLGMDSKGNIYTSLRTGEVVMVKDDGSYEHIAWVPSKERAGKDLAGLTGIDKADNIYVINKAPSKYDDDDSLIPPVVP